MLKAFDKIMFLSVDRIEEDKAVCIDDCGVTVVINVSDVDKPVREGCILIDLGGKFMLVEDEESRRRRENFEFAEDLFDE